MTPPIDHAAAWEAMSDTEKVEFLATHIMGWRDSGYADAWLASKARGGEYVNGRWVKMKRDFQPFSNWNHTMQVVEALQKRFGFVQFSWWDNGESTFACSIHPGGNVNRHVIVPRKNLRENICFGAFLNTISLPH